MNTDILEATSVEVMAWSHFVLLMARYSDYACNKIARGDKHALDSDDD